MKNMLIAAAALGTIIAGLIWFFRKETYPYEELGDSAIKAIDFKNEDAPHLERGPHAMG